jgi:hypothetical protein
MVLDLFQVFIAPLESELAAKSSHAPADRMASPAAANISRMEAIAAGTTMVPRPAI